jgi:type II secretory pathway component PulJ
MKMTKRPGFTLFELVICVMVPMCLVIGVALYATLGTIAWHFISKFW